MSIEFRPAGVSVRTSPKVLSTSLGLAAFELENGRKFEPFLVAGRAMYIHRFFPARPPRELDPEIYPVVAGFFRDPVDRFVSMFKNRVVRKHERSAEQWEAAKKIGLNPNPSFDEFVINFGKYQRRIPEIKHHSQAQVTFLGRTSEIDHMFLFSDVPRFLDFMSTRIGRRFSLPYSQSSQDIESPKIGANAVELVEKVYAKDYAFLSKAKALGLFDR